MVKKKYTQSKIGCFSFENGLVLMGNCAKKISIEKVKFSRFGRHIQEQSWQKHPVWDFGSVENLKHL